MTCRRKYQFRPFDSLRRIVPLLERRSHFLWPGTSGRRRSDAHRWPPPHGRRWCAPLLVPLRRSRQVFRRLLSLLPSALPPPHPCNCCVCRVCPSSRASNGHVPTTAASRMIGSMVGEAAKLPCLQFGLTIEEGRAPPEWEGHAPYGRSAGYR